MTRFYRFLVVLTIVSFSTKAQTWLALGVKGGVGPTFIFNNNLWSDNNIGNLLSGGNYLGGTIGLNFGDKPEITLGVGKGSVSQTMSIKASDSLVYEKDIAIKTFDYSLLYRHHSSGGGYVEIGPTFSQIKSAEEEIRLDNLVMNNNVVNNYEKTSMGVTFGFGATFIGTGNLSVLFGTRFTYGITDLVSSTGGKNQTDFFPVNDGYYSSSYSEYKNTHPLSAMIMAEITYDLGFFTKSNCKNGRTAFLSF